MEVKVNKADWESLSDTERERIQAIIGSHFQGMKLTSDPNAAKSLDAITSLSAPQFSIKNPLCTAACGVAEAAAVAACSALSGGTAIAVCVAAAHEAGNYCRSRC